MPAKPSVAQPPPMIFALSGSAALVVANTLLYPIDTVTTKLQAQSRRDASTLSEDEYYKGFFDAFFKILRTEGVSGLYAGLPSSILTNAMLGYSFNYWHSALRQRYLKSSFLPQPLGTGGELAIAYFAAILSVLGTNPLVNVATRQNTTPKPERKGILGTAQELIGESGISRLWRGITGSFVLCFNPAITYGTTERLRVIMFPKSTVLSPSEAFSKLHRPWNRQGPDLIDFVVIGMVSKAIAIVALQPVSVAQTGLRAKPPPSRKGKHFNSFLDVILHTIDNEGFLQLWKGLAPTLVKSVLLQGLLNIFKER